jgi:hypothetical protein
MSSSIDMLQRACAAVKPWPYGPAGPSSPWLHRGSAHTSEPVRWAPTPYARKVAKNSKTRGKARRAKRLKVTRRIVACGVKYATKISGISRSSSRSSLSKHCEHGAALREAQFASLRGARGRGRRGALSSSTMPLSHHSRSVRDDLGARGAGGSWRHTRMRDRWPRRQH